MKTRLLPTLMLIAVLLAACSASATQTETSTEAVIRDSTATNPPEVATVDQSLQPTAIPTQEAPPTALPIATSRGPELEATDPTTVTMASGELQFIEFFEFW